MSTKILISEINRIGQIMYNNNQNIIIENLLLEVNGGTGLITKVAEKLKLFKTIGLSKGIPSKPTLTPNELWVPPQVNCLADK